jgi:hypothetical protein
MGATNNKLLAQQGKDTAWLEAQIHAEHVDLEDVALATIDDQDHIRVCANPLSMGAPGEKCG